MNSKIIKQTETEVNLSIVLDDSDLADIKRQVFNELRPKVKADGFRPGKAPDQVVEKQLGSSNVQQEVIERAINRFYGMAINSTNLKPLDRPEVALKKFVAYTELEFEASVELLPKITLPDYKKKPKAKAPEAVKDSEVEDVLKRIGLQSAQKNEVKRAAKKGDEVWIDFKGVDAKGKPVKGADGKDYPLSIGSKTFIPGFEEEIIGLKEGAEKTFTLTFPKDYHAKLLAGTKVTFEIKVNKVKEVVEPKFDDDFAKTLGPFDTIKQARDDIRKQIEAEKQQVADRNYREEVISKIVDGSKLKLPKKLVEQVRESMVQDFDRELAQRNLSKEDYYKQQGQTEAEFEKELTKSAEKRTKSSLVLTELAEVENITLSNEELDAILEQYKKMYAGNEQISEDLKRPEIRREIAAQALTEKTIEFLVK